MLYNANVTNTLCIFTISLYQLHIMHYLPAQVCTMSSPHQHCRGRRSGEQGDCTQVLRHIASGQPQGTQPRVAVTTVLWMVDSMYFLDYFGSFSILHDTIYKQSLTYQSSSWWTQSLEVCRKLHQWEQFSSSSNQR